MAGVITSQSLQHTVPVIGENMLPSLGDPLSLQPNAIALIAGLPRVPSQIFARIEVGEFIDMGELLPDRVGITRPDDTGKASAKCHTVAGILE